MMRLRICSWFAGFIMALLAFRFMPTWKECTVFMCMYIAVVMFNMRIGQRMYQDAYRDK